MTLYVAFTRRTQGCPRSGLTCLAPSRGQVIIMTFWV
ncbi:hypothetical protein Cabther_A1407 [Chloracidobacterium thermophilum B]|uniref:Uncharacterized protein n=1 Tax=Chloracidobacterium thermophilum (strain B) TaxID=981222 RepID=G2LG45_CHLTF|nr:hypothetical protein Cabther_A1407 [Chloracidobacterium thermophilum B]